MASSIDDDDDLFAKVGVRDNTALPTNKTTEIELNKIKVKTTEELKSLAVKVYSAISTNNCQPTEKQNSILSDYRDYKDIISSSDGGLTILGQILYSTFEKFYDIITDNIEKTDSPLFMLINKTTDAGHSDGYAFDIKLGTQDCPDYEKTRSWGHVFLEKLFKIDTNKVLDKNMNIVLNMGTYETWIHIRQLKTGQVSTSKKYRLITDNGDNKPPTITQTDDWDTVLTKLNTWTNGDSSSSTDGQENDGLLKDFAINIWGMDEEKKQYILPESYRIKHDECVIARKRTLCFKPIPYILLIHYWGYVPSGSNDYERALCCAKGGIKDLTADFYINGATIFQVNDDLISKRTKSVNTSDSIIAIETGCETTDKSAPAMSPAWSFSTATLDSLKKTCRAIIKEVGTIKYVLTHSEMSKGVKYQSTWRSRRKTLNGGFCPGIHGWAARRTVDTLNGGVTYEYEPNDKGEGRFLHNINTVDTGGVEEFRSFLISIGCDVWTYNVNEHKLPKSISYGRPFFSFFDGDIYGVVPGRGAESEEMVKEGSLTDEYIKKGTGWPT